MTKEMILENVLIKPVNITRNGNYLNDKLYIRRFNDIAGVFYISVENSEFASNEIVTAVIKNEMLREFDLTIDELEFAAKANAKYVLMNIGDVTPTGGENPFKVLTTPNKMFGGAAIFDDSAFKTEAYILPSSIHELLILDEINADADALRKMVQDINRSHLRTDEVLSDDVFYFDGKEIKEC